MSPLLDLNKFAICCLGSFVLVAVFWSLKPDPVLVQSHVGQPYADQSGQVFLLSSTGARTVEGDSGQGVSKSDECGKAFLVIQPEKEKVTAKKKGKRKLLPSERLGLTIPLSSV